MEENESGCFSANTMHALIGCTTLTQTFNLWTEN